MIEVTDPVLGRLQGRTAIVTGASRGIGLGVAKRLVGEGARVVITGRKQDALNAAVSELGGTDVARGVSGRADDQDHQKRTVERALDAFGSIDMLVNNAGINPVYGRMIDLELGSARKIVEVNVLAALSWVQQVHQAWQTSNGGAVVNISSISGVRPSPNIGMYGASKAMLSHITRELALELGPDVRVNAVAPALVKTRLATALYEGREDAVSATYPLKRLGRPADLGSVVAFLLSDDASWITGQVVVVDGGLLLTGGA